MHHCWNHQFHHSNNITTNLSTPSLPNRTVGIIFYPPLWVPSLLYGIQQLPLSLETLLSLKQLQEVRIRYFLDSCQKFSDRLSEIFWLHQKFSDSVLYRQLTVKRNPHVCPWGNQKISDIIRKFLIAMGFLIPFLITIILYIHIQYGGRS